jgi:acetyl-CoA C-acetyltransferase
MAAYIKGVGMTRFGSTDRSSYEMCSDAIVEAVKDADVSVEKIDAIVVARNDFSSDGENQRLFGGMLSSLLGRNIPILQVSAACASGGVALWNAIRMEHENVLAVGVEKLSPATTSQVTSDFLTAAQSVYEQDEGLIFPAQYALVAQQFMKATGTTVGDLGLVALKNHDNASLNEKAKFFGKNITKDLLERSFVVCSPFRVLDCSISVDGAAAVIVSKSKTDIEIAGSGLSTSPLGIFEMQDLTSFSSTKEAARQAYAMAGIIAQDVSIAEVHDAFTSAEIMAYEDLGFSKKGEGKQLIREGKTKINGQIPVNMSGGLKARGHPVGATGLAQIYELVKQMRELSGKRQVSNAKIGLSHNVGGCGTTAAVHVLRKL